MWLEQHPQEPGRQPDHPKRGHAAESGSALILRRGSRPKRDAADDRVRVTRLETQQAADGNEDHAKDESRGSGPQAGGHRAAAEEVQLVEQGRGGGHDHHAEQCQSHGPGGVGAREVGIEEGIQNAGQDDRHGESYRRVPERCGSPQRARQNPGLHQRPR